MALIKCPECKKKLSDKCSNCPHCGYPIEKLCEADVYFDTAYILRFISEDMFKKILKKHGEDKILFATDTPWSDIKTDVNILKSFKLDKKVENKIFYENAKKLLGI